MAKAVRCTNFRLSGELCRNKLVGGVCWYHGNFTQAFVESSCPVCMETISKGAARFNTLACGHMLCLDCSYTLYQQHVVACPLCRTQFDHDVMELLCKARFAKFEQYSVNVATAPMKKRSWAEVVVG